MRPATDTLPKPLLPVAGEPFVVHQLRWLASEGVTDVVYSIGYLGDLLRAELSHRTDLGCQVRFADEGSDLRGTGGAVRFAIEQGHLGGVFFLLYGDSYLDVDVGDVLRRFETTGAEALMTVYRNDGELGASNVQLDGLRIVRYDKDEPDPPAAGMHHIDYGLSILRERSARARIPERIPNDLADMMRAIAVEGGLAGFEAENRFFEIGSPSGLAALREHLEPSS